MDEISKAELADVIESVASAVEEEFDYDTDIFNYYCITEDKVYLYETAADYITDYNSTLSIFDMDKEYAEKLTEQMSDLESQLDNIDKQNDIMPLVDSVIPVDNSNVPLDKGVAARLRIENYGISYMVADVDLPTIAEMSGVNNTSVFNYIYIGFSDEKKTDKVQSDMGLQSARRTTAETVPCGFKPYFRLYNINKTYTTSDENQDNFVYTPNHKVWFYLPSASSDDRNTITLELYKNVNSSNVIRGNVYGLGVYSSNEIQAKIETTIDIPTIKSSELAPITYWKAVNTLSPNGTGVSFKGKKSQCIFSNFMINGKNVPLSKCSAAIYNKGTEANGSVGSTANGSYLNTVTFTLNPNW